MLGSLIILIFFVIGTLVGYYDILPFDLQNYDADKYTLYLLMFLVGIGIGSNKESLSIIKKINWKMVIIPLITIVGTFLGVTFSALFISGISIYDIWAIGAGYGYYSLSSIYISSIRGEALGAIALLSNIIRELFTLVFTPVLVRYFGKIAPISSGGATSMDTTLPIITKYSGSDYALISVFHGTVLTVLVPIIVTFFANLNP